MLEVAAKYYTKTAESIRANIKIIDEKRMVLFNQLLIEEVLLFYKICKIKGLEYSKMLSYFEQVIERLKQLKNNDLMLKIAIDLIDTLKYKLSEINPEEHF